jgi:hypothetical protein
VAPHEVNMMRILRALMIAIDAARKAAPAKKLAIHDTLCLDESNREHLALSESGGHGLGIAEARNIKV